MLLRFADAWLKSGGFGSPLDGFFVEGPSGGPSPLMVLPYGVWEDGVMLVPGQAAGCLLWFRKGEQ